MTLGKNMQRSIWLLLGITCALAENLSFQELPPAAQRSIEDGLKYLASEQNTEDGAWYCDIGYKLNNTYQVTKKYGPHVGVTSLACMAFMANGNLPGEGVYGENVRKGLKFVLSCVHEDTGYISRHGTRMYSHAFATLFLAEVYGTTQDPEVGKKLKKAVDLIVTCQNETGGWRYEPQSTDADMSVTVCQVQALRAAKNAGVLVSKNCIERAINYIRRSATWVSPTQVAFTYQPLDMRETRVSFSLTAAGVTALHGAGVYEDEIVRKGLNYLLDPPYHDPHPPSGHYFYYYGHYYAVQAMYLAGRIWPEYWQEWFPKIRDELVSIQNPDGSWQDNVGKNCATAMALLILEVPYRYLPIFQR